MTTAMFLKIIWSMIGTVGFSLVLGNRLHRVPVIALGSFLVSVLYVAGELFIKQDFLLCFLGASFATIFAEIAARILKAPATVFLAPTIVPLIPGGSLYYATYHFVTGAKEEFLHYGIATIRSAFGIAMGILFVSTFVYHVFFKRTNISRVYFWQ